MVIFFVIIDRTIMSPFCESAKMAALPLNKFPHSKTASPLTETTASVLTSLPYPFYKSHCSPRLGVAPSSPGQPGSLGLPLNFALWMRDFSCELSLRLAFFLTFGAKTWDQVEFPALTLLSQLSSGIWAALPGPLILENAHSLTSSQGSFSSPACLQLLSTTGQSSLKALSPSVSPPCKLSCGLSLSHFLKNPSVRSQLTLIPGTGFLTWDACHLSPQVRLSPWELDHPKFL
jgi:hypothetical protein